MLRWWSNDSYSKSREPSEAAFGGNCSGSSADMAETRTWKFQVRGETFKGETVCVTGDCDTLGNWSHDKVFPLARDNEDEDGDEHVWSGVTKLPLNRDIEYRYVICVIVEPDDHKIHQRQFIVRRWETNIKPRVIKKKAPSNACAGTKMEPEVLGFYDNKEKIERGWLTTETAIQLKLFNNHLQIWKAKLKGRPIYVKVTPINLARSNGVTQDQHGEDCLSLETMDLTDKSECWPLVEISVMNQGEREFRFQEQFGRAFNDGDFVVFQILVHCLESVAILVDFYSYAPRAVEGEPPVHIGFSYILPSVLKGSEGQAVVPITSVRHRPIGQITVEFLIVKPIANSPCNLKSSLQRLWKESWRGLDVGHRGVGTSFKGDIRQCAEVRENTIASLKSAASHGADFVEFDVQLSKDLVPVLYHDFYVAIAMRRKKQVAPEEMIQLPVKDLSLAQLHLLKGINDPPVVSKVLYFSGITVEAASGDVGGESRDDNESTLYHVTEFGGSVKFSDEDLEEHQPFPTLQQALEILDSSVGFNIEIKWTMQLKDGTYEFYHPFDLNLYLDTVLEVVLQYGGSRNIVFSCFHPDICSMIRLKQNKYPVMFLTQGITDKYPAYHDPRCQNVPMAVHFALNMGILGINVHTEDLLRDSSQVTLVKRAGLVLFCWGDDNNDTATIKHLKDLGIHAVIYDKIDQYSNKEVKESIFRLEARESERLAIRAVAERASVDEYLTPEMQKPEILENKFVVESGRTGLETASDISLWHSADFHQSTASS